MLIGPIPCPSRHNYALVLVSYSWLYDEWWWHTETNLNIVNKQLYKLSNTIYQLEVRWSVTLLEKEIKSQHSSHFSAGSYDAFTTLMVVIIFQLVERTASQSFSKQHSMNPHFLDQCSWVGGLIIWRKNVQARNKHNISMILVSNHWKLSR